MEELFPLAPSSRPFRNLCIVLLLLLLSACGGGGGGGGGGGATPATLVAITVTPDPAIVGVGGSLQLSATGTYDDSSTADITATVTWISSDPGKATVNAAGLLGGVVEDIGGTLVVTASLDGIDGTTVVYVTTSAVINGLVISPDPLTLDDGATQQLTVTGTDTTGANSDETANVTWLSSDDLVATVDAMGMLTAQGPGTATITAQLTNSLGQTVTDTLLVNVNKVLLSISVTPSSFILFVGDSLQLAATGTYSDGSTQDITTTAVWGNGIPANFTVSNTGLVTGVAVGPGGMSGSVTLSLDGVNGAAAIDLYPSLSSIAITPDPLSLYSGSSVQLTVTAILSDASNLDVTSMAAWGSTNDSVVTVDATGMASGGSAGSATVTADVYGVTDTLPVQVQVADTISVSNDGGVTSLIFTEANDPAMVLPAGLPGWMAYLEGRDPAVSYFRDYTRTYTPDPEFRIEMAAAWTPNAWADRLSLNFDGDTVGTHTVLSANYAQSGNLYSYDADVPEMAGFVNTVSITTAPAPGVQMEGTYSITLCASGSAGCSVTTTLTGSFSIAADVDFFGDNAVPTAGLLLTGTPVITPASGVNGTEFSVDLPMNNQTGNINLFLVDAAGKAMSAFGTFKLSTTAQTITATLRSDGWNTQAAGDYQLVVEAWSGLVRTLYYYGPSSATNYTLRQEEFLAGVIKMVDSGIALAPVVTLSQAVPLTGAPRLTGAPVPANPTVERGGSVNVTIPVTSNAYHVYLFLANSAGSLNFTNTTGLTSVVASLGIAADSQPGVYPFNLTLSDNGYNLQSNYWALKFPGNYDELQTQASPYVQYQEQTGFATGSVEVVCSTCEFVEIFGNAGGGPNVNMYVYSDAGAGTLLHSAGGGNPRYALNPADCSVYIKVVRTDGSVGTTHHYSIGATATTGSLSSATQGTDPDGYEPDDTTGAATALVLEGVQDHTLSGTDTTDWFIYTPSASICP